MSTQNRYHKWIEEAIAKAKEIQDDVSLKAPDGAQVYAYPARNMVYWGVNRASDCVNMVCGARLPNGRDSCVKDGRRLR